MTSPTDKILPHAPIDTTRETEHVTNTPHNQLANRTRQSVILKREIQLIQASLMTYETTPSITCNPLIPGPEQPTLETRMNTSSKRAKKNQDGAPAATDRGRTSIHT